MTFFVWARPLLVSTWFSCAFVLASSFVSSSRKVRNQKEPTHSAPRISRSMFVRRTTLVVRRPRAFPPLLRRTVWAWSSDALVLPANQLSQRPSLRGVATAATITTTAAGVDVVGTGSAVKRASGADTPTRGSGIGPINQYDAWVAEGRLHDDAYQRGEPQNVRIPRFDYCGCC